MGEQGSRSETPFVSVAVSFHNEGAALRKCLPSLLSQTYPHEKDEVVLVDDGSNDGSVNEEIFQFVRPNTPPNQNPEARVRGWKIEGNVLVDLMGQASFAVG